MCNTTTTSIKHSREPLLLHHTVGVQISSSPLICRFHCSSSRTTRYTHCPLDPSIHNLHINQTIKETIFTFFFPNQTVAYVLQNYMYIYIPGGVPQHIFRSSMCSISRPINQAPSDTSSLAYLCSIALQIAMHHI